MNCSNIYFENRLPIRKKGLISFIITELCVLGDCYQPECHHCFPVKDCKKHKLCITDGTCKFIPIPKEK